MTAAEECPCSTRETGPGAPPSAPARILRVLSKGLGVPLQGAQRPSRHTRSSGPGAMPCHPERASSYHRTEVPLLRVRRRFNHWERSLAQPWLLEAELGLSISYSCALATHALLHAQVTFLRRAGGRAASVPASRVEQWGECVLEAACAIILRAYPPAELDTRAGLARSRLPNGPENTAAAWRAASAPPWASAPWRGHSSRVPPRWPRRMETYT